MVALDLHKKGFLNQSSETEVKTGRLFETPLISLNTWLTKSIIIFISMNMLCSFSSLMIVKNHLAEKGFIHRDLAARNILVGSDDQVKVSDFGLMREIYEDVYNGKNTKKLPVKWMAPESINYSIYTIKSDV